MSSTADRFVSPTRFPGGDGSSQSEAQRHSEGPLTRKIEDQTAKLPSDFYLMGAVGSIGVSLLLQIVGEKEKSHFVGQWVAPFLLLGVYNKLVKVAGSDRLHKQ